VSSVGITLDGDLDANRVKSANWPGAGTRMALILDLQSPVTIYDIAWRPGGRAIAAAGYGGVRIWRLEKPETPRHLQWQGASLRLAWSPSGTCIATGDQDATVHFWQVASGQDLMAQGYDTKVRHLSWDGSSRFLATAGGSDVLVWDCSGRGPAGTTPRGMEVHEANVSALAFQERGGWLLSGDRAGDLVVWKPRQGPRTAVRARQEGPITSVAWAGDGRRFVAANSAGLVETYEAAHG
jgi:WD40 repeat protein